MFQSIEFQVINAITISIMKNTYVKFWTVLILLFDLGILNERYRVAILKLEGFRRVALRINLTLIIVAYGKIRQQSVTPYNKFNWSSSMASTTVVLTHAGTHSKIQLWFHGIREILISNSLNIVIIHNITSNTTILLCY